MKSNKFTIGLGIVLLLAALLGIILAVTQASGLPLMSSNALEPEYDFGDAPDPTYPTLLGSDGARHLVDSRTYLGTHIDTELDGQPDVKR